MPRDLPIGLVLLAGSIMAPPGLGSEPQTKPGSPPRSASRPGVATATPGAKIKVADASPEDALRTFMLAVMAHDEAAVRVVTLPNPDLDWLLKGPAAPAEIIREASAQFAKLPIKRLKPGEKVTLPRGKQYVVVASEISADKAVLLPQGAPLPTRLQRVEGHWKVSADPFIAGRKAADAARKKSEMKKSAPSKPASKK